VRTMVRVAMPGRAANNKATNSWIGAAATRPGRGRTHWMWNPRAASLSRPLISPETVTGEDSDSWVNVMTPWAAESPLRTAIACLMKIAQGQYNAASLGSRSLSASGREDGGLRTLTIL
jgi:hypothetical protein